MTAHIVPKSAAEASLAQQFEALGDLARSPRRAAAFKRFSERGLPTRRVEAWHYTDLRAAMSDAAPLAPAPTAADVDAAKAILALRERQGARIVLVNGRFVRDISDPLPPGATVTVGPAPECDIDDPVAALNEAMSGDGPVIDIAAGAEIATPIEIVHLALGNRPFAVYAQCGIVLGTAARASFLEAHLGAGQGVQRNVATTIVLSDRSKMKHAAIVADGADLHLESQIIELGAKAELDAFGLVAGGALVRRQIFAVVAGEGVRIALGGLALLDGSRRADTTLQVHHAAPNGTSREFYRAIVDDEAAGTFQGKVIVAKGAQKTDGAMKSQAVLLSSRAQMNAKPELEIFADDVVCGHGATVSALDPEQVFYLRSRGIPEGEAEAMLLEAFGQEAIDRLEDATIVEDLRRPFLDWLVSKHSSAGRRERSLEEAEA